MSGKQKTIQANSDSKNTAQQISVPKKKASLLLSMAGVFKGDKKTFK